MIQPTCVTFEQAKMLKEKEFKFNFNVDFTLCDDFLFCNYCQQWEVIEWLRVNHGIWIIIEPNEENFKKCSFSIFRNQEERIEEIIKHIENDSYQSGFNTPQEAYSAAFDHILKNLI